MKSNFPRWIPLLGGLLSSTTCGLLLYAFSIFIKPLMDEFSWTVSQVSMAYALICLIFGTFPTGRLSDRIGPRKVVFVGGLLMAFGFFMVSTIQPPTPELLNKGGVALQKASKKSLYLLYFYYSVVAGIGGSMVYLPPIATAPKWWPDKRALATGFSVVGLGLGSFIMAPMATKMIAASGGSALPVFKYVGIAMAVMVIIASMCLKLPPIDYKPVGWNPSEKSGQAATPKWRDYTYQETKKSSQFWILWLVYFCGSFGGLMVIGLIAKHGIDAMSALYRSQNSLAVGTAIPTESMNKIAMAAAFAPSILAVTNAAVRVMIGSLADKIGTKTIFIVVFLIQAVTIIALYPAGKNSMFLAVCAALIGWNYGAMFTLFPTTLIQYYGSTAQASNYGLLFTSWGVAGFFGPYLGGKLQMMTGSFFVPFLVAGIVVGIAAIILMLLKAPDQKPL